MSNTYAPSWEHYRARIASLSRDRAPDDPELVELRAAYKVAWDAQSTDRAVRKICRAIVTAPALTSEQRNEIINAALSVATDMDGAP